MENAKNNIDQPATNNLPVSNNKVVINYTEERQNILESKVLVGKYSEPSVLSYDGDILALKIGPNVIFRTPISNITKFKKDTGIGMPVIYIWVNQQMYRIDFSGPEEAQKPKSPLERLLDISFILVIATILFPDFFSLYYEVFIYLTGFIAILFAVYRIRSNLARAPDGSLEMDAWISLLKENSIPQGRLLGGYFRKPWFIFLLLVILILLALAFWQFLQYSTVLF